MFGAEWARVPVGLFENSRVVLVVKLRVWMVMVCRSCNWDLRILTSPN